MWWRPDLPASATPASEAEASPAPEGQGEFLLEWILPGLGEEARSRRRWSDATDGGKRRQLRRELREAD